MAGCRRRKKKREGKEKKPQEWRWEEERPQTEIFSRSSPQRGCHRAANPPRVVGGGLLVHTSTHAAGAASVLVSFHRFPLNQPPARRSQPPPEPGRLTRNFAACSLAPRTALPDHYPTQEVFPTCMAARRTLRSTIDWLLGVLLEGH